MTKKQRNRIKDIETELDMIGEGNTDILNGNETFLDRSMSLAYELIELIEKLEDD